MNKLSILFLLSIIATLGTLGYFTYSHQDEVLSSFNKQPPVNPLVYELHWNIYLMNNETTTQTPPITITPEIENKLVRRGTGKTYYNWLKKSQKEVYDDFCVPIESDPRVTYDFPCTYLTVENGTTYLINNGQPTQYQPECCTFPLFVPTPAPYFPETSGMKYVKTIEINDRETDIFTLNVAPPTGPFFYGWSPKEVQLGYEMPSTFSFPTVPPNDWTQQDFTYFRVGNLPEDTFDLPQSCKQNPPVCIVFGDE